MRRYTHGGFRTTSLTLDLNHECRLAMLIFARRARSWIRIGLAKSRLSCSTVTAIRCTWTNANYVTVFVDINGRDPHRIAQ